MKYSFFYIVMASSCLTFGQNADPQSGSLPAGSLTLGGRFSESIQEFTADYMQPLLEEEQKNVILNLRGFAFENQAQEYNLGLIYRTMTPNDRMILGINAYYDGRFTEEDHYFSQLGAGAELLTEWVDFRSNYYRPVGDTRKKIRDVSTEDVGRTRNGNRITTTTTTTVYRIYEEAMEGFDVEAGIRLPILSVTIPTRIFGGYYAFDSDFGQDREGFRARLEARLHPRLTLDAEWYEDDTLNGTDYFVGFRFHIPLGSPPKAAAGLSGRMSQAVYRDFHIRTIQTPPQVITTNISEEIRTVNPESEPPAAPVADNTQIEEPELPIAPGEPPLPFEPIEGEGPLEPGGPFNPEGPFEPILQPPGT